jgi:hypothetical protein
MRGLGDSTGTDPVTGDTVVCPSGNTFDPITGGCYVAGGAADCYDRSFVGPLPPGAVYCAASTPGVPAGSVPGSLVVGSSCFMPMFPFVGNVQGSQCVPIVNVPSPWNTVLTVLTIGGGLFLLFGGRRR